MAPWGAVEWLLSLDSGDGRTEARTGTPKVYMQSTLSSREIILGSFLGPSHPRRDEPRHGCSMSGKVYMYPLLSLVRRWNQMRVESGREWESYSLWGAECSTQEKVDHNTC